MHTTLKHLSAACAGALLLACAGPGDRPATQSAEASYAAGRQAQLAGHYDDARKAYLAALAVDAAHVNARNGLASLYAEQGDYAHAIPIWQQLTEKAGASSGPANAYLFGNLGYAYLLSGDYDKAEGALEKACVLDPLNHRSWQHLGDTLFKQGKAERARQMYRQAIALREHDFRADYAAAGAASPVGSIDSAAKAEPEPDRQWASTDIRTRADGMLELYRIPAARPAQAAASASISRAREPAVAAPPARPAPASAAAPATVPVGASAPRVTLLEIRNGNGVTGMAKALSGQLGDPSMKVVRLTNEKGFAVRQTRVEYHGVFRASAQRLAERIGSARLVEVESCKPSDIRLVLGRDLGRGKLALRPLAPAAPALAIAQESGKAL